MSPTSESSPLLAARNDSYVSTDTADCQSKFTLESRIVRLFFRRRFWWFCVLGIAAIITLQLSFLPRTSVNRDFRRWHDLHLTRTDVRRIFLVELRVGRPDSDGLTIEEHVNLYLRNFTAINKKHTSSLASSDASELASFVEQQMRSLGFKTQTHKYPLLDNLRLPLRLSLHLLDSKSGRKLYTAPLEEPRGLTPSFFTFGKNGTVKGEFIYANNGLPADYDLLLENNVSPQDKIVIFSHSVGSDYSLADKILYAESLACLAVIVQGDPELELSISRNFKPESPVEDKFRLPVSFSLVQPILEAMGSPNSPFAKWKYLPRCADNTLQLELISEFAPRPLNATNIVAEIDGVINDGEIIVGASRDVLTSSNPLSGHAVMLEVIRRFHNLRKLGWRPLRNIRFISWDSARSGALGALASVDDFAMFQKNLPILAYINLDDDLVTGSHFSVDANPLFNHLIEATAKLVPFSKNSTYYKRLLKDVDIPNNVELPENINKGSSNQLDDGDDNDEMTSLYHYWRLQNNATINNKLGSVVAGKDTSIFQLMKAAPVINLKYEQSPSHNDSIFVPESDYYSYRWLTTDVDKLLELHGLLVRFVGLFVLSLEEHEVVDSKAQVYFEKVKSYFHNFEEGKREQLSKWKDIEIQDPLLIKSSLYNDLKIAAKDSEVKATVGAIFNQTNTLLNHLVEQAQIFDQYNKDVEDLLTVDYPWYKMLRKVHIYAKFKVANYKTLRLEKELVLLEEDDDSTTKVHHFMYEVPKGFLSGSEKLKRGAFASLYEAVDGENLNQLVKLIVTRYELLKSVFRKIT